MDLILLSLLFVKHWYIDFVNQSDDEVKHKGIYLDWRGVKHSLKHGIATLIIFFIFGVPFVYAWLLAAIDFLIHYHVDYCKMRYGCRDITKPLFWNQLGLDQLAHSLTYIALIWMIT
jgi:hypothetical protein